MPFFVCGVLPISTSLERSLHDHLRAFVTQCDPSIDDQHNVDALTRIDDIMIDMEGADEERIEFVKGGHTLSPRGHSTTHAWRNTFSSICNFVSVNI